MPVAKRKATKQPLTGDLLIARDRNGKVHHVALAPQTIREVGARGKSLKPRRKAG